MSVTANVEMLRRGYAQLVTISPNVKDPHRFLKFQREAREARRGLWERG
jgi:micrococcal nuclease